MDILLGAFNRIVSSYPDAMLNIYANAQMWNVGNEYEVELGHLNSPSAVYHGVVHNSRMPEIFSRHSVLCLPSYIESFSLVSIEAQACGCVPVVHDTGGVSVTLQDGQTGFLYSPNTAENLADTIDKAFKIIDADSTIRSRCRKFICDTIDLDRNVDRFLSVIQHYKTTAKSGCKKDDSYPHNGILNIQKDLLESEHPFPPCCFGE